MALLESAIGGVAVTVLETAFKAGGAVAKQIKGAYKETQATQRALAAAQKYAERYNKRHCQVKVMPGLMKEPLPLEEIYTAVKILSDWSIRYFVGLDDVEETYRAKGQRSFGQKDAKRQDGMIVANTEQFLMVLGGPGIGKSTFLRKVGMEALRKNGQIQRDCIPVMIELKELRDANIDLKQKIANEFAICGFPEADAFTDASLAQGKLLVLLDGLDEVPTKNLYWVLKHVEDFVDIHNKNAFIASCRIAAYRSNFFRRFTDVTLAEFDDDQIEQFIRRWFRAQLDLDASIADTYWQLLQKDENKATKELAQTPLLLTFLCLVYDRKQMLATKRSMLYGSALDILLSDWAAQKRIAQEPIYEGFYPELEKVLLAQIAYDSFAQNQLFFLKENIIDRISSFLANTLDAPKFLDGPAVLKAIERQQGILVERVTNIYSFSHLTMHEYLTAFHIKEEGLEANLIAQYLTDERWREVILLVAGLVGNKAITFLELIEITVRKYLIPHHKLIKLVQWADAATLDTISPEPITRITAALAIASAIDIVSARDSAKARTSAIDSAKAIGVDIDSIVDSIIDIARARARARANIIDINSDIDGASSALTKIFNMPKLVELPAHLQRMRVMMPGTADSSQHWYAWADELETLWLSTLGLSKEDLTFSPTETEALRDYLYASVLLLRCKDAAIRVPKKAWKDLEARLLTWPD